MKSWMTRTMIGRIFGVFSAIGALHHGIGLTLQGYQRTETLFIYTWTQGPIARSLGGEPGMTLVPNLFVSGILTLCLSMVLMMIALFFLDKRYGAPVFLIGTLMVLLTGGGIAPPVIGILAGISAWMGQKPVRYKFHKKHLQLVASAWRVLLGASLAIGFFVFFVGLILTSLEWLNHSNWFVNGFLFLVVALILLISGEPYHRTDKELSAS